MKITAPTLCLAALPLAGSLLLQDRPAPERPHPESALGAFSVSLTVADLDASTSFYKRLGFEVVADFGGEDWRILRSGDTTIGLFHGLFERNILTFNPGWDAQAEELSEFTDVRELERRFRAAGLEPVDGIDPAAGDEGPASFVLVDPDGNPVFFDQHVD
ncbi:MAG: VOC family protein [Planctomycetota bacterium]